MSGEMIYVSWGGTGRGAALRAAYEQAADSAQRLTYLAILDPPTFADLDSNLLALVIDELEWLLHAHMRTVAEASHRDVETQVVVRTGEVDDEVEALSRSLGATSIVVGAPVTIAGTSVDELVVALRERTGCEVAVIGPGFSDEVSREL